VTASGVGRVAAALLTSSDLAIAEMAAERTG
jgi:hypothetical protein